MTYLRNKGLCKYHNNYIRITFFDKFLNYFMKENYFNYVLPSWVTIPIF